MARYNVTLATERVAQHIDHFGASGCWLLDPVGAAWTESNKNKLADLLFSQETGIGLSLFRFNIGAGSIGKGNFAHPWRATECFKPSRDEPYDWNAQHGQQWFAQAAKERGCEYLLAFVNSPPTWLTRNGKGHGEKTDTTSNLVNDGEREFAEFLVDVLRHFEEIGLRFDYISPINEPNWEWAGGQEGCKFNNDEIKAVVRALSQAIQDAGLTTEIDVIDGGDLRLMLDDGPVPYRIGNEGAGHGKYREWIKDLLGDPEICALVDGRISCHSYWTVSPRSELIALRRQLRENIDRYVPNGTYWMSEYCIMESGRDLSIQAALKLAELIHFDLTVANASAWHWWLAVSNYDYKDGLIYTSFDTDNTTQDILPAKLLWALGNWSRFVRPGTHRIEVEVLDAPETLLVSAYVRPDKKIVVVAVNQAHDEVALNLDPAMHWEVFTTDATRDLAKNAATVCATVTLPAESVVTLVQAAV